jgi:hypothetical protein
MPTVVSPNDFITFFNKPGEIVRVDDYEVNGNVRFNASNFKCNGAVILNTSFTAGLFFDQLTFPNGIRIQGCKADILSFGNVDITSYSREVNGEDESVVINETEIKSILKFTNCNIERDLKIEDKCQIGKLYFGLTNIANGKIFFDSSTFTSPLDLEQVKINGEVRFQNSEMRSKVRCSQVVCSNYVFLDSTFKKDVWLWSGEAKSGISINNGVYEDDFTIQAVKSSIMPGSESILTIAGANFRKTCAIYYLDNVNNTGGGASKIFISSSNFDGGLSVTGPYSPKSKEFVLSELNIQTSNQLTGEINISYFQIKKTILKGVNFKANIFLQNIRHELLFFDRFSNYGNFHLVSNYAFRDKESHLDIFNSHLENTQFVNTDLDSFKKVSIIDSNLSQISTSAVKWFSLKKLEDRPRKRNSAFWKRYVPSKNGIIFKGSLDSDKEVSHFRKTRELFRQLKFAMEKQGDKIQSLIFKQAEMAAFKKELQLTRPFWSRDRFVLWLNQSNDYGQNWVKPALFAFGFTTLFYGLIVISHSAKLGWTPASSWVDIRNTFYAWQDSKKMIPQLLNPIHSMDKLLGEDAIISGYTLTIDYLLRLILAYFIFQTVSAFRKFSK